MAASGRIGRMARYVAELEQPSRASPASRDAFGHVRSSVLAFAGLGLVTARSRHGWLGELDRAAISAIRNGRSAAAVTAARAVSALAEPGIAAFPLAAAVIVALRRAGWRAACGPYLTVASGVIVRRSLSRAIARPRPPSTLWLTEPEGFSFPSKHTALAALTTGACVSGIGASGLTSYAAPLLAAIGVGAGRVYLGVHWPSDVLAGWLFAVGWLHLTQAMLSASAHATDGCPRRQQASTTAASCYLLRRGCVI